MQNITRITTLLIITSLANAPLWSWKSKYGPFSGTHQFLFERAFEILAKRQSGNTKEWAPYKVKMAEWGGSLKGDANAHGNILVVDEHSEPPGGNPPEVPEEFDNALNFNSGPFYRYFIRSLELAGQINALEEKDHGGPWMLPEKKEASQGIYKRAANVKRTTDDTYRYLAYMGHLVQDQCAVAHAANIRHDMWEGIEWWHWDTWSLGGGGVAKPGPAEDLAKSDITWFWNNFYLFHRDANNPNSDYDRGQASTCYKSVRNAIGEVVISDTKNLFMSGLSEKLKELKYFEITEKGGRRLPEKDLQALYQEERDTKTRLGASAIYQKIKMSQFKVAEDANIHAPSLSTASKWPIADLYPMKTPDAWASLNGGHAMWLPHPQYVGEQFDTRWGSYGGHWGLPGRSPVAHGKVDFAIDFFTTGAKGRIMPGDLYAVHAEAPYEPAKPESSGHYMDERSITQVRSMTLDYLGMQMLNRGAAWTAAFLDNVSRAIPPTILFFNVKPRQCAASSPDPQVPLSTPAFPVPTLAGRVGATLDVDFFFNRVDDYQVEFFAIPLQEFKQEGNWRRKITLNVAPKILWQSDINVNDGGGENADNQQPEPSDNPGFSKLRRDYDFCYANLKGYPLKVVPGKHTFKNLNLAQSAQGIENATSLVTLPSAYGKCSQSYTWTGEVEAPRPLYPEPNEGGPASNYQTKTDSGKSILPGQDYLILVMAYHKDMRHAFGHNQFKSLSIPKH